MNGEHPLRETHKAELNMDALRVLLNGDIVCAITEDDHIAVIWVSDETLLELGHEMGEKIVRKLHPEARDET